MTNRKDYVHTYASSSDFTMIFYYFSVTNTIFIKLAYNRFLKFQ